MNDIVCGIVYDVMGRKNECHESVVTLSFVSHGELSSKHLLINVAERYCRSVVSHNESLSARI